MQSPKTYLIFILALIAVMVMLAFEQAKGQDTLKVPVSVIDGAMQDRQGQIEAVMSGKTTGNVYYLQGGYDMLAKLREYAIAHRDTVKTDTTKTAKKVKK